MGHTTGALWLRILTKVFLFLPVLFHTSQMATTWKIMKPSWSENSSTSDGGDDTRGANGAIKVLVHKGPAIHRSDPVTPYSVDSETEDPASHLQSNEVESPHTFVMVDWQRMREDMQSSSTKNIVSWTESVKPSIQIINENNSYISEHTNQEIHIEPFIPYPTTDKEQPITSTPPPMNEVQFFNAFEISELRNRLRSMGELGRRFEKIALSFSRGLILILPELFPNFHTETSSIFSEEGNETEINSCMKYQNNSMNETVLKNMFVKYRVIKRMYLDHLQTLYSLLKLVDFGQLDTTPQSRKRLGIPKLSHGKRHVNVLLAYLQLNAYKVEEILLQLDNVIDSFLNDNFMSFKTQYEGIPQMIKDYYHKTLMEMTPYREVLLKISSSSTKASINPNMRTLLFLCEHHILDKILIESLRSLTSSIYCKSAELQNHISANNYEIQRKEKSLDTNETKNENVESNNENNISQFSTLVTDKFKHFVIDQVKRDFTDEIINIFTVPFMAPYRNRISNSNEDLYNMIVRRVKEVISLLRLSELFDTFRSPNGADEISGNEVRDAEEMLLNSVVPYITDIGKKLIEEYSRKFPNEIDEVHQDKIVPDTTTTDMNAESLNDTERIVMTHHR